MALFYFQMSDNGQKPWVSFNPPQIVQGANDTCVYANYVLVTQFVNETTEQAYSYTPKTGYNQWVSGANECTWAGATCNSKNTLWSIELCKCIIKTYWQRINDNKEVEEAADWRQWWLQWRWKGLLAVVTMRLLIGNSSNDKEDFEEEAADWWQYPRRRRRRKKRLLIGDSGNNKEKDEEVIGGSINNNKEER
jgi:hypothetical protein